MASTVSGGTRAFTITAGQPAPGAAVWPASRCRGDGPGPAGDDERARPPAGLAWPTPARPATALPFSRPPRWPGGSSAGGSVFEASASLGGCYPTADQPRCRQRQHGQLRPRNGGVEGTLRDDRATVLEQNNGALIERLERSLGDRTAGRGPASQSREMPSDGVLGQPTFLELAPPRNPYPLAIVIDLAGGKSPGLEA